MSQTFTMVYTSCSGELMIPGGPAGASRGTSHDCRRGLHYSGDTQAPTADQYEHCAWERELVRSDFHYRFATLRGGIPEGPAGASRERAYDCRRGLHYSGDTQAATADQY